MLRRRLEYDIPIYSNYTEVTYEGFEEDIVNSVKVGTLSGLKHVTALLNAVGCNIQSVYSEIFITLVKREHLDKVIHPRIASNKTTSILRSYT